MAADVFLYLYKGDALLKGGSTDAVFPNAIALKSFSMEAEATIDADQIDAQRMESRADRLEMPFAGERAAPEKPLDSFSIEFSKEFDRASTELFKNYALVATKSVVYFAKAEVYCRIGGPTIQPGVKPEQLCFLFYEFRNLYVYEYSLEVGEESSIPTETCKLYFDKYRITYRQQLKTGKLGTPLSLGWDFEKEAAFYHDSAFMATADIFLELIGLSGAQIKGESQDAAFPYHIELKSFTLRGPSFTSKKRDEDDKYDEEGKRILKAPKTFMFSITKEVDKSTPVLVQTYSKNLGVNAQPFSKAIMRFRLPHAGTHLVFLVLIFTEVHLTKYDVELKGETSIPEESLDFAFKGLEIQYSPQTNTGDASSKLMTASWPPASSGK